MTLIESSAVLADTDVVLACIEVGASTSQTALVDAAGHVHFVSGIEPPPGVPVRVAAPGFMDGTRVVAASNLGWYDVPVARALGLDGPVEALRNDAEAAALGEHVLRGAGPDLVYVGLGTGVGGGAVRAGQVVGNLLGHRTGFGDRECPCSARGCLETVAAGWALTDPATPEELEAVARAVARAVEDEPLADAHLVVVAGGLARRHPTVVDRIAELLPHRGVEPTAAPPAAKSAAAWGLLHLDSCAEDVYPTEPRGESC